MADSIINIDITDEIRRLAGIMSPAVALGCLKDLNSALWKLDNNANIRLLLEVTLLSWPELDKAG